MTAINVLATPSVGFLSADAAVWNGDGTVRETVSKIITVEAAATAVAASGIFSHGLLRNVLHDTTDLPSVMNVVAEFAMGNEARVARSREWDGWKGDFLATGISWHGGEAVAWQIGSDQMEPMRIMGLRYSPDVDLGAALGRPVASSVEFAALPPETSWLGLMQAQRRLTIETTAGGLHCVGGWCDLATVTADGIRVQRLTKWPDRIGRKITP